MRVLTLCYEYPPLGGGAGRIAAALAREIVSRGHQVDVVTMAFRSLPRSEVRDGVRVRRIAAIRRYEHYCSLPEAASFLASATLHLPRRVRRRRYDLTHSHFILPDGWSAWRLRRMAGLPYLVTAHGSDVPGYNPERLRLAHRLLRPLWRRIAASATTVVSPSRHLADLIEASAPRVRARIVPHGIEVGAPPNLAARAGILVVSRLLRRKRVDDLLEALGQLDGSERVDIVGDGPDLARLSGLAEARGVPVTFHGWLENPSPELEALYGRAAVFVLPSESENFPVSLLEAMRAGLAIVTTRGTGCAEVVGDAALLVDPGRPDQLRDALAALQADPSRRRALGERARRRVEQRFSWNTVGSEYLELYAECRAEAR